MCSRNESTDNEKRTNDGKKASKNTKKCSRGKWGFIIYEARADIKKTIKI